MTCVKHVGDVGSQDGNGTLTADEVAEAIGLTGQLSGVCGTRCSVGGQQAAQLLGMVSDPVLHCTAGGGAGRLARWLAWRAE